MQYPNHLILDSKKHNLTSSAASSWPKLYFKKFKNQNISTPIIKLKNQEESRLTLEKRVLTDYYYSNCSKAKKSFYWDDFTFNFNFLRKERLYTKLKYSRCPQYDIVSGGWAALFAGLIGFLISEKFGIELVDSGDFYNALMYLIFLVFSLRPLLRILGKEFTLYDLIIIKELLNYLLTLLLLVLSFFKVLKK